MDTLTIALITLVVLLVVGGALALRAKKWRTTKVVTKFPSVVEATFEPPTSPPAPLPAGARENTRGDPITVGDVGDGTAADRSVYERIKEILPWDSGIILFVKSRMRGAYQNIIDESRALQGMEEFLHQGTYDPAFQFFDPELERIRTELLKSMEEFQELIYRTYGYGESKVQERIILHPTIFRY